MSIEKIRREAADEGRLQQLRDAFPEVIVDGRVSLERLRELLDGVASDAAPDEHYGLNWPGKQRARRLANNPPHVTLRPVAGAGVDDETTKNLVVVGDNLQVMLALQASYANSVKLVYIDPPYNTGTDFIYKDSFAVDEELYLQETRQADLSGRLVSNAQTSGRFHSNWLNFMYPRLRASRALLRSDGLLAVHIDEHELENLVLMCKEIFGEENYLGTAVWDKGNPKGDSTGLSYQHESIVLFAKDAAELPPTQRPKPNAQQMLETSRKIVAASPSIDEARKEYARWVATAPGLSGGERAYSKLDATGRIYQTVSMAWPNKKQAPPDYFVPLTHPVTKRECPVPDRGWRNPSATMQSLLAAGKIAFGADETTQPRRMYYLDENLAEGIPSILRFASSDDALLKKLGIPFDHPKPVDFSAQIIGWFTEPGDIVLDYFAGSGTTGHATWLSGVRFGGDRQFILIQIDSAPEAGGAATAQKFPTLDRITCERLRKASQLVRREEKATGDVGFRVFREDSPALARPAHLLTEPPSPDRQELLFKVKAVHEALRPAELFAEVLLLLGFPLDAKGAQVPQDSANTLWRFEHPRVTQPLLLCLDPAIDGDLAEALRTHPEHTFVCRDEALTDLVKARLYDELKLVRSTFKVL